MSAKNTLLSKSSLKDTSAGQLLDDLLASAVQLGASDIHIEPRADCVQIRYRIDGILRPIQRLSKKMQIKLTNQIKAKASLISDESVIPQDGQFQVMQEETHLMVHVSTLPITDGEKIVLRLLRESSHIRSLKELGLWGRNLSVLTSSITQPQGMVLVSGPLGSGKATTLFSILSALSTFSVSISTVEESVERTIVGANQTQVNQKAGISFASGIQALLRQDPNIIMVSDIRDRQTAEVCIQAALTGRMIFSTLTVQDAPSCLNRLVDMGIEPFLVASSIRATVGQRLVRTLCQTCRVAYVPDQAEVDEIKNTFGIKTPAAFIQLHEQELRALEEGVGAKEKEPSTNSRKVLRLWKAKTEGCKACGKSGYQGRIGIYEVLEDIQKMQQLVMTRQPANGMYKAAVKTGMIPLQVDGLIKALRGLTTISEVLRVTGR